MTGRLLPAAIFLAVGAQLVPWLGPVPMPAPPPSPLTKMVQAQEPSVDPTSPTEARPWGRWDGVEGAYCLHGDPLPDDHNGHKCGCQLMCQPINDGSERIRVEDHSCATYCRPAFKSCACHPDVNPEDPCGAMLEHESDPFGLKPEPPK